VRAEVRAAARGALDSEQCLSGATPDCPVRPSTAATPNGCLVVEGYKYPSTTSTPTIQAFNTLNSIQEKYTPLKRHDSSDRSAQSPQFNSSALGLVRGSFVFLCCSCLLGWLSFISHFLLSSFVSEARDTNCVVVLVGSKWPVRLRKTRSLWPPQRGLGSLEPNLGKTNHRVHPFYFLVDLFSPLSRTWYLF
jgi:hypothetical protein